MTERHQDPVSQIQRKGESKTYRMKEKEKAPRQDVDEWEQVKLN